MKTFFKIILVIIGILMLIGIITSLIELITNDYSSSLKSELETSGDSISIEINNFKKIKDGYYEGDYINYTDGYFYQSGIVKVWADRSKITDLDFVKEKGHDNLTQLNASRALEALRGNNVTEFNTILDWIDAGENDKVLNKINTGFDVNTIDYENGYTALFSASVNDNIEILTALIKAGADVNQATKNGFTPLMVAARYGNIEILTALINAGADVNARTTIGVPTLGCATELSNVNVEIIKTLIKAGADVNASFPKGNSVLTVTAAMNPNIDFTTTLIKAGADVNARNDLGESVLMMVAKLSANAKILSTLIDAGADPYYINDKGDSALVYALSNNNEIGITQALLDVMGKINLADNDYIELLKKSAAMNDNPEIAKILKNALRN